MAVSGLLRSSSVHLQDSQILKPLVVAWQFPHRAVQKGQHVEIKRNKKFHHSPLQTNIIDVRVVRFLCQHLLLVISELEYRLENVLIHILLIQGKVGKGYVLLSSLNEVKDLLGGGERNTTSVPFHSATTKAFLVARWTR